ncbi:hypothetical protein ACFPA8_00105 [Streptomyces ovatisporus]|uniref:Lipoprotein n=1 Tax=Streptomyces ovatisporus TaxID=1128682 RepID=A0ABV8ZZC2_9ACTN
MSIRHPGGTGPDGATGFRGRLRARYGASPLHLLLVLASFALTAYAGIRLLKGDVLGIVVWFAGAALVHDLLLLPLYTVTDRALQALLRNGRRGPRGTGQRGQVNYVRVPAFVSLVLLLVWYPLILERVDHYTSFTGLDDGVFWGRWLLITAALFAVSALCLVVRTWRARPRRADADTDTDANTDAE